MIVNTLIQNSHNPDHLGGILVDMDYNLDFGEWISQELETRSWSMRELGRRSGFSHPLISGVIDGREPSWDFCAAVAIAFGESPIKALLIAGKLTPSDVRRAIPSLPEKRVSTTQRLISIIEELSEEDQAALLRLTRGLVPEAVPPEETEEFTQLFDGIVAIAEAELLRLENREEESNQVLLEILRAYKEAAPAFFARLMRQESVARWYAMFGHELEGDHAPPESEDAPPGHNEKESC